MQFKMVSYADNFEDVLIRRAFPDIHDGFYIDVGAFDPVEHSVTHHFSERGWRGINIEPNPAQFARIQAQRDRDVNLNFGLSNQEGQLSLYEAPGTCWAADLRMLTGYFGARADQIVEHKIPVSTLAQVCERHVPAGREIEFLSIDVEGHEGAVIEGGDWSRWRPRIVVCEANEFEKWDAFLLSVDYLFALFDGVNRFYVRKEDKALLPKVSVPVNISDSFLIHGYLKRINELERSLSQYQELERTMSQYGDLNPMALRVARGLSKTARRHPRAASIARKIARRLYA
jgi:FkbM family methyltransferase